MGDPEPAKGHFVYRLSVGVSYTVDCLPGPERNPTLLQPCCISPCTDLRPLVAALSRPYSPGQGSGNAAPLQG